MALNQLTWKQKSQANEWCKDIKEWLPCQVHCVVSTLYREPGTPSRNVHNGCARPWWLSHAILGHTGPRPLLLAVGHVMGLINKRNARNLCGHLAKTTVKATKRTQKDHIVLRPIDWQFTNSYALLSAVKMTTPKTFQTFSCFLILFYTTVQLMTVLWILMSVDLDKAK